MNSQPLWFFWGQPHMTYLRWLTLYSAKRIHEDVRLIVRSSTVAPRIKWTERQDFQYGPPKTDWMPKVAGLGIGIYNIEDVAPDIAGLGAPDIQTSDLLAWYLLSKFGGAVADMDIAFLKPLPEIKEDVELVVFSGSPKPGYVPVGYMQGRPCAAWAECHDRALTAYRFDDYESCGSRNAPNVTSPGLPECIVYPWAGAHAWGMWSAWLFWSQQWPPIPDDCIGLHWYAGHNQAWNQKIRGPDDLHSGAMAWAVKEVLA